MLESFYLFIFAMIMEFIDSALGMMYGTVLSPLLILMGYDVKTVVPSILISQSIGGFIASWRHHRLQNANFQSGTTDFKISTTIIWFGVFACLVGVFISVSISPKILNTYIAVLVIVIGIMILLNKSLIMTAKKIYFLGFLSAFNKALSGGGFGENYGHVIQEALIGGCPVVISDQTPWRKMDKLNAGYDISLAQEEKFINALQSYVDMNQEQYDAASRMAFEYGNTISNVDVDAKKMLELFLNIA